MLRHLILSTAITLATLTGVSAEPDKTVGYSSQKTFSQARNATVNFTVWYPAESGWWKSSLGENGVFEGTSAFRFAELSDGRFPLILISHGGGGNALQFSWIASELAAKGFVVAAPNHPGSTSRDFSFEEVVKIWKRPADLSAVLTALTTSEKFSQGINFDKVGVMGFSAGGYAALAIAGAQIDPKLLAQFCDKNDTGMSDCEFLERGGVDLHKLDLSPAAELRRDPRIRTIVSVDPGIVRTLTPESLANIDIPVSIINLGRRGFIPNGVLAEQAAATIPGASYTLVEDATHFTFLPVCKPAGAQILIDEGEIDSLCEDSNGRSRQEIHDQLAGMIAGMFMENLK